MSMRYRNGAIGMAVALPIEYRDILKALNKKPADIGAIERELEALSEIDSLCAI